MAKEAAPRKATPVNVTAAMKRAGAPMPSRARRSFTPSNLPSASTGRWLPQGSAARLLDYPLDGLTSLQLGHDSRPLSAEGSFTTDKSFRLPWLRDDDAPAT